MATLDTFKPAKRIRPPRILLLGTQKIGKSTFACDFDSPVCIPVIREEGIDDMDVDACPTAKTFMEVIENMQPLISESHDYKTFVIDSLSTFSPLIYKHACESEGVASESVLGGGYGHQNDTPLRLLEMFLDNVDQMRTKGMASILIGHVTAKRFDDPLIGSYTRYDLDVPKVMIEKIYRWADLILFANWKTYVAAEDVGFGKEVKRGTGSGERVLYTQNRAAHPGGGRGVYGRIPYELPFTAKDFFAAVGQQIRIEDEAKNG